MNTLSYKTISINKETAKKEWVVVDATDQVVGRFASKVAKLLRGKYKPTFTPHVDCGDNVIIINAEKVVFTGKKETDKVYKTILSSKENIVLTGMPGCGKSTIGKMLAERLGRPFIDLDDEIVKMAGKPISEIFSEEGEKHFRNMETEAIKNVALISGAVIATGGGAVLRDENVRLLKQNGRIYFLDRPLEQILPTADRPLATSREAVINRYNERFSIYTATCDTHLKTDGIAEHTVEKIIKGF
jgi:ribosomal protein L13